MCYDVQNFDLSKGKSSFLELFHVIFILFTITKILYYHQGIFLYIEACVKTKKLKNQNYLKRPSQWLHCGIWNKTTPIFWHSQDSNPWLRGCLSIYWAKSWFCIHKPSSSFVFQRAWIARSDTGFRQNHKIGSAKNLDCLTNLTDYGN